MIRLARLRSTEWDGHKFTAVVVGLAKDVESVTRPGRQISKSITHGAQRSMQGVRLSETLMREALDEEGNWNEAFIRTPESATSCLKWHRAFPPVRQWHRACAPHGQGHTSASQPPGGASGMCAMKT